MSKDSPRLKNAKKIFESILGKCGDAFKGKNPENKASTKDEQKIPKEDQPQKKI